MVFRVDTDKMYLSSESRIFKTERFIKETARMSGVDDFLTKIAEAVTSSNLGLWSATDKNVLVSTEEGAHTVFFRFGKNVRTETKLLPKDIIFFHYVDREKKTLTNDQRFIDYFLTHKTFTFRVSLVKDDSVPIDFQKLYRLANVDNVNFPLLTDKQKEIVTTEDKNMLVQGVAGSGKTNLCIDKIIWSACRAYTGRVLYSTYSRGLLIETKTRVNHFKKSLSSFIEKYRENKVVFCDSNCKACVENRLGLTLDVDDIDKIIEKTESIIAFLDTQVDYYLLEDLYKKYVGEKQVADENFFIKDFVSGLKNHRLAGRAEKIKDISYEVVYKEIFGMIYGSYPPEKPQERMSEEEYVSLRGGEFGKAQCEVIYSIALDYGKYMEKNGLVDNNLISRELLAVLPEDKPYSLVVLDEVQDFTQVNLFLFRSLCFRMFCVGDALQMINPSYFGFAYLKRLLFTEDEATVAELKHNYRNTEKIEKIIEKLGQINISQFGTHSFVLKGQSVDSDVQTSAVYVRDRDFAERINRENFDNFTIVCASAKQKETLRKTLKRQEILTVSEIKGLERDAVLLYDVLSDNIDKWRALARRVINRKTADENSVYRYYFNLFYVGVSRAKQYLYVVEKEDVPLFGDLFDSRFERLTPEKAIESLSEVIKKTDVTQEEIIDRIRQFISLGQYDNGRFLLSKVEDDVQKREYKNRIDVHEAYIRGGEYRNAGIRYWELGMTNDAKEMFSLSGDQALSDLIDALSGSQNILTHDIVGYYPELMENEGARTLILSVLEKDLARLSEKQNKLNKSFKEKLKR